MPTATNERENESNASARRQAELEWVVGGFTYCWRFKNYYTHVEIHASSFVNKFSVRFLFWLKNFSLQLRSDTTTHLYYNLHKCIMKKKLRSELTKRHLCIFHNEKKNERKKMKYKIKIIFVSNSRVRNNARAPPYSNLCSLCSRCSPPSDSLRAHTRFNRLSIVFTVVVVVSIIIIFIHTFARHTTNYNSWVGFVVT